MRVGRVEPPGRGWSGHEVSGSGWFLWTSPSTGDLVAFDSQHADAHRTSKHTLARNTAAASRAVAATSGSQVPVPARSLTEGWVFGRRDVSRETLDQKVAADVGELQTGSGDGAGEKARLGHAGGDVDLEEVDLAGRGDDQVGTGEVAQP